MSEVRIGRRTVSIEGVSSEDVYYRSIQDGFEDDFDRFCRAHLKPDAIALDVGANIGVTSTILSQALPLGHVHAFEPAPKVFAKLKRNITFNGLENVSVHHLAIGREVGTVRLQDNSAWGHITDDQSAPEVAVTTIDSLVDELRLPTVDFIKIDTEGFERAALDGGKGTLQRFSPLIYMEFNSWCMATYNKVCPVTFFQQLAAEFAHVLLVEGGKLRGRLTHTDAIPFVYDNIGKHGCWQDLALTNNPRHLVHLSGEAVDGVLALSDVAG